MNRIRRFNESFDIINTIGCIIIGYFVTSRVLGLIFNRYNRKMWTNHLSSLGTNNWEIVDTEDNITAIAIAKDIGVEIILNKRTEKININFITDGKKSRGSDEIDLGSKKFRELASGIKKSKEISEDISDFALSIKDIGFECHAQYGLFNKKISLVIKKEGHGASTLFEYSEIESEASDLIKRCSLIGLFLIEVDKVNLGSSVDDVIGIDQGFLKKLTEVKINFEIV